MEEEREEGGMEGGKKKEDKIKIHVFHFVKFNNKPDIGEI